MTMTSELLINLKI